MDKLIRFLNIDPAATRHAAAIWSLIEHRIEHIIETFYADVRQSDAAMALSDQTIQHLKVKQKDHWRALFESRLDLQYFNSASLIGIKHAEIGLDPKWYIAGYARIKGDFARIILNAPLPLLTKADLVVTLDKYVALDMALAISSYTSLLVD
ncbi:MAG: protoglobin domain-containing protein [Afipia sp.]|nr:protoglobin domain-containing protein [Afipia sp.]